MESKKSKHLRGQHARGAGKEVELEEEEGSVVPWKPKWRQPSSWRDTSQEPLSCSYFRGPRKPGRKATSPPAPGPKAQS